VAHEGVADVGETLLIEAVLLDGIVYEVERGVADNVRGPRVADEESEAGLPC
jgi:hypothetical protein